MPSASEYASAKPPLGATLAEGVNTLSAGDEVTFTKYIRLVLPLDGFIFWVRSDLVAQGHTDNPTVFTPQSINLSDGTSGIVNLTVPGSLHYSTQHNQAEAESEGVSTVIFTSLNPIQQFNESDPNVIWIGEYPGDLQGSDSPIRFAFSSRGNYYRQADLYHYSGTAVLPAFYPNIIDDASKLNIASLYVSNSLPVWLAFSNYDPPYDNGITNHIQLYPSFIVPENLPPPYGAVHIDPQGEAGIQAAPYFDSNLSQYQLVSERVRITLYGLSNAQASMFLAALLQYSYDYNYFGISNIPVIKDEKRIQPELSVIAEKKTIDVELTYNQGTLRSVARQHLEKVLVRYLPQQLTAVGFVPPAP